MLAYHGRLAVIDLTRQTVEQIGFDSETARKYLGGSGLATHLFMKYARPGADPLGPDNPLVFMTGPFTGTAIPTSGRHHVVTKSPLTGIFCEGDAGGTFGFKLKRSGFDGLIILGRSAGPVYLTVIDGEAAIHQADDLWGLDTYEVQSRLEDEYKGAAFSCIGPAGERLVSIAGIFHDGRASRTAARGGMGAVMGSKNLKAIVVKGAGAADYHDKKGLAASIKEAAKSLKEAGAGLTNFGTTAGMAFAEELGGFPVKNWREGSWSEKVHNLTGQTMSETILEENYGCHACPIRCGRVVRTDKAQGRGPEYETMAMLGPCLDVDDLEAIAEANDLCNRYGLDTISTGGSIAWAMELYELGVIDDKDAGRPLKWGDSRAVIELIHEIGQNSGFGRLLGKGVRTAARELGRGSEDYAIHVKGMELPAHDPRCFKGLATGYATSNRGACHLASLTYPWERSACQPELGYPETFDRTLDVGKGEMTAKFQNLMGVVDSLKVCKFAIILGLRVEQLVEWINLATGWDMDFGELMRVGERVFTLKRVFNQSLGLSRKDDILPKRILEQPRGSGGSADTLPDLSIQLDEYYAFRGWTPEGLVPEQKLIELGLEEHVSWLVKS